MRLLRSLGDLGRGIYRHPWLLLWYIFTSFSVLFTVVQGLDFFAPGIQIRGLVPLVALVIISICYGLKKVWKPSTRTIKLSHTNSVIELTFGDIFKKDGITAIAVTQFFDSKIGMPVSGKSLHGIFLNRFFTGNIVGFDQQLAPQLQAIAHEAVQKVDGKQLRYPIGTTALITPSHGRFIVFALAGAEPTTCKAYCDVTMMWNALSSLWERARIEANGEPVNVPLIGSGLSGLGLPTRDLVNLIVLSAITETKATVISHTIRIVLHRDRFEDVDLREVQKHWEE